MYLAGNPLAMYSLLSRDGGVSPSRIFRLLIYTGKNLLTFCFGVIEMIFLSRKIEKTQITSPPVFILGHYRSGTTLLHKLLASDSSFGYIRYLDIFYPVSAFMMPSITNSWVNFLIRTFKIKNIFFNKIALRTDDPGEEDLYMISGSSKYSTAWGFAYPRSAKLHFDRWAGLNDEKSRKKWERAYKYHLKRITLKNGFKPLVLKSPPNTARVKHLLEMFPGARFIYLYRNPYHVYCSMENLWKNVIERYFALQKITVDQRRENIFTIYSMLMKRFEEDKKLIPPGHLVEVRFEDLENDPLKEIRRIYSSFGIEDGDQAMEYIRQRLVLEKKYSKYDHQFKEETLNEV